MKRLVPLMAALALSGCGQMGSVSGRACVTTASPEVRLPVIPGRPGAGYFELYPEQSTSPLVAVTSPRIGRIEMHETIRSGNRTSMRPTQRIEADECGRIALSPGGNHLMLFEIDPRLRAGESVTLVLRFADGRSQEVSATVRDADTGHGGH